VLLVDNAGWHVAKRLVVPANVRLFGLPSCTSPSRTRTYNKPVNSRLLYH
jgi:hypothetical protein